jgi:hypothetical protein
MLKYILVSAIIYFILSRYVFQGKMVQERFRYRAENTPTKEKQNQNEYVEYEEVD